MKKSDLVLGKHVCMHDDGTISLVVEEFFRGKQGNCFAYIGGTGTTYMDEFKMFNDDLTNKYVAKYQINKVGVMLNAREVVINNNFDFINWIWERDDKVECIIDGQKITLSRESVDELKKLK